MTVIYNEVLKQVDTLDIAEQLRLATYILEQARQKMTPDKPRRKWSDVCGLYAYPMLGEDAQAWVSRTRREADENRSISWQ